MSKPAIQAIVNRALIVGMGGLGCPVAELIAEAGVKDVGLCDLDVVDASNLPRQTLYEAEDIGRRKVDVAGEKLAARFGCTMRAHGAYEVPASHALLADYDVVVECSDQIDLKFAVSDAAVKAGRFAVIGGAVGYRGFVLAMAPGSPCLRCVFEGPSAETRRTCADAGVLGTLPSVVGAVMAEAVIGGGPRPLWSIDARDGRARESHWTRRADCPACGAR